MEVKPAYIAVSIRPDFSQVLLSVALHLSAAAVVVSYGGLSVVTILFGCIALLSRFEYWAVLMQWPRQTAVSRLAVVQSGSWYLTAPDGFVHGARLIGMRRCGGTIHLLFMDNEWRRRRIVLGDRNCSSSEKLRLALYLDYLATLPGLNRSTPFWLHQ